MTDKTNDAVGEAGKRAADKYFDGAKNVEQAKTRLADIIAAEYAEIVSEHERLRAAIESVLRNQPCVDGGGGVFYPHHDGDGNEIGVEYVDPLAVLGSIYTDLSAALAAREGEGEK